MPGKNNQDNNGQQDAVNPVLEALTARLIQQGRGISTSSSSNLQASINEAIASTKQAGRSTEQRLQSEREREVAFAQDRASATYTTALEGRTGYATQTAALRELTDTTEKSIRDLDKRYQESILANDANTASTIAGLRVKKLEFQQQQEQNYYQNIFALGNLQEQAISRAQQGEQFWSKIQQDQAQFTEQLKDSRYQFDQNYGLQLEEIGIKKSQLELERQRNNISWAEYNLKSKQIERERRMSSTEALVAQDIKNNLTSGVNKDFFLTPDYLATIKNKTGYDGSLEDLSTVVYNAYNKVSGDKQFIDSLNKPVTETSRSGGVLGGFRTAWSQGYSPIFSGLADFYLGKKQ